MSDDTDRIIGRLEADVAGLQRDMDELRKDVKTLLEQVASAKGGWKVLAIAASAGGALGATLMKAGTWLLAVPVK